MKTGCQEPVDAMNRLGLGIRTDLEKFVVICSAVAGKRFTRLLSRLIQFEPDDILLFSWGTMSHHTVTCGVPTLSLNVYRRTRPHLDGGQYSDSGLREV